MTGYTLRMAEALSSIPCREREGSGKRKKNRGGERGQMKGLKF